MSSVRSRFVIFTATLGQFDHPRLPQAASPGFDFVCFTDRSFENTGPWMLRGIDYIDFDPARTLRYIKTHPHVYLPDYERSIWVEGNLLICDDLGPLMSAVPDDDQIGVFRHPTRASAYAEASEVIRRGLDDYVLVEDQINRYRVDRYPEDYPLSSTTVMIRSHNRPGIREFNLHWWREVQNGSRYDQISFDFVAWKLGTKLKVLGPPGTTLRDDVRFRHMDCITLSQPAEKPQAIAAAAPAEATVPYPYVKRMTREHLREIKTEVIICVRDALENVRPCLLSLRRHNSMNYKVVVVDDASHSDTARFLASYADANSNVHLCRINDAVGYTRAVNVGLRESTGDFVVLLASDTIVPAFWMEKLVEVAESVSDIGLVGPLSNAATWQSIPTLFDKAGRPAVNCLPIGYSVSAFSQRCAEWSDTAYPKTTLLDGFCVGIKRSVIQKVGYFDEEAFPHGVCEMDDYVLRAWDAGFAGAIATHLYVYHARSKSFAIEKIEAVGAAIDALCHKFPRARIANSVKGITSHPVLAEIRDRARELRYPTEKLYQPLNGTDSLPGRPTHTSFRGAGSQTLLEFDLSGADLEANEAVTSAFMRSPKLELTTAVWFLPPFGSIYHDMIHTALRAAAHFADRLGTESMFVICGRSDAPIQDLADLICKEFPKLGRKCLLVESSVLGDSLVEFDAAFCTNWTTAYFLARFHRCRAKFYFLNDFEPLFYPAGSTYGIVEQTYRLGFVGLANTPGVAERYRIYNPWITSFVPGVDRNVYRSEWDLPTDGTPKKVVFCGDPRRERSAFQLGIHALGLVKAQFGDDLQIVSEGAAFDPVEVGAGGILDSVGQLSPSDAAALYRSCHAGLFFHFTAHPSYRPAQFMASGCITVTNYNPSTAWLLKDGENAALCEPTVSRIAERMIQVLRDSPLRARVLAGGMETASGLNWDNALDQLTEFIQKPRPASSPSA